MGYELRRWLRDQLPASLPAGERAVALEVADRANDTTRRCWPNQDELAAATGLSVAGVRKALQRLSLRGWELRVELAKGSDGRPVYACRGHRAVFLVPHERSDPRLTFASTKGETTVRPKQQKGETTVSPKPGKVGPWSDPNPQDLPQPFSPQNPDLVPQLTRQDPDPDDEWSIYRRPIPPNPNLRRKPVPVDPEKAREPWIQDLINIALATAKTVRTANLCRGIGNAAGLRELREYYQAVQWLARNGHLFGADKASVDAAIAARRSALEAAKSSGGVLASVGTYPTEEVA